MGMIFACLFVVVAAPTASPAETPASSDSLRVQLADFKSEIRRLDQEIARITNERQSSRSDGPVLAWLTTGATLVLVLVTGRYVMLTKKLVVAANKSADAMKQSAEASHRSARLAELALRPTFVVAYYEEGDPEYALDTWLIVRNSGVVVTLHSASLRAASWRTEAPVKHWFSFDAALDPLNPELPALLIPEEEAVFDWPGPAIVESRRHGWASVTLTFSYGDEEHKHRIKVDVTMPVLRTEPDSKAE